MTNNKKELYSKREFLNKRTYHSIASVGATLEYDTDDRYQPLSAEFSISNCDRTISLAVDCYDLDDLENSVHKIQQIEETAKGLKEALIKAKPLLEQWIKEKEEKEAEEKLKNKEN